MALSPSFRGGELGLRHEGHTAEKLGPGTGLRHVGPGTGAWRTSSALAGAYFIWMTKHDRSKSSNSGLAKTRFLQTSGFEPGGHPSQPLALRGS